MASQVGDGFEWRDEKSNCVEARLIMVEREGFTGERVSEVGAIIVVFAVSAALGDADAITGTVPDGGIVAVDDIASAIAAGSAA